MKPIHYCLSVILVSTIVPPLQAAVFERDWKTTGDGLLTYDDVNQREWLDLSQSRLSQFPEPRLENAIAQIAPGGLFDGFTWAKRDDVRAFAESVGIDTSTSNITTNLAPTTRVGLLLGPTLEVPGLLRAVGLMDEVQTRYSSLPPYDGGAFIVNFNPNTGGGYAGISLVLSDDLLRPTTNGLLLYRPVPEPAGFMLVLVAIGSLVTQIRWRTF
jgi:hypothetical protein